MQPRRGDLRVAVRVATVLLLCAALPGTAASIDPALAPADAPPAGTSSTPAAAAAAAARPAQQVLIEQENAAIAAQAAAAIAANQPTRMLVSFRVTEQQVQQVHAAAASRQSAGVTPGASPQLSTQARRAANAAVKARVLGAAVAASSGTASSSVVEEAGARSTADVASAAAAGQPSNGMRPTLVADFPHLPVALVSISSAAQLASLRANPDVLSVVADGIVRPMAAMNGLELIGQPDVAAASLDGQGTIVVIDTGLDYTRAVFGSCSAPGVPAATCKVLAAQDVAADDGALDVGALHGTNVGGVILGVAPGARLISLDVFDKDGTGAWSTLIAALDWVVANRAKYNIVGANLSLGGGKSAAACDDHPLATALNTAHEAGVVSVVAAGNDGFTDSLSIPGCASKAVSVGAVFPADVSGNVAWAMGCTQNDPKQDQVVCFSNSNEGLSILAPGYSINAAGVTLSGTSQATPFVAGALAVLRHRFPGLSAAQLVAQLTSTGTPVTDQRNGIVKPRLNLRAAVGSASSPPPTPPVPAPSPSPQPPAPAACTLTVSPASAALAAAGGSYALQVTTSTPACTWSVAPPADTWVRVVGGTSGIGPGLVALQVDANTAGAARSAALTVSATAGGGGGAVAVSLDQASGAVSTAGDVVAPIQSRVTGLPARLSVQLTWAPATDAGSSVASYRVVYNAGATAPRPRCASGTPVARRALPVASAAGGTPAGYRLRVTGLLPATPYTFRVCAVDAAGNVAAGVVWRGSTRP